MIGCRMRLEMKRSIESYVKHIPTYENTAHHFNNLEIQRRYRKDSKISFLINKFTFRYTNS